MAADAANCESYLGTGTKEKVEMSQSGRLQRSSCFLCCHYLQSFRLQDALCLHLKEIYIYTHLSSNQYLKISKRCNTGKNKQANIKDCKERLVT